MAENVVAALEKIEKENLQNLPVKSHKIVKRSANTPKRASKNDRKCCCCPRKYS